MSYVDFRLWAPTEDEALLAGYIAADMGFPLANENGWNLASHRHAFDPIGTVWSDDAVYDTEGELVSPPTAQEGWFANVRVRSEIADDVEALLNSVAALGVLQVTHTGREWA